MSIGTYSYIEDGVIISDMIDPWGLWLIMTALRNTSHLLDFLAYRRQLSLFVKIADERQGSISPAGRVSKPLADQDRHRLNHGAAMARRVLIKAGCRPDSIIIGPTRGAHPMSTAPIGRVVDKNLATEVKNLYVSDASVIPRALDRPVVLTLICLAKRLADHLLDRPPAGSSVNAVGTA
jgi:choline dehydrogenase-like flavoprotein